MGLKSLLRHVDRRYTKGRLFLIWRGVTLSKYRRIIRMSQNPILIGGCGRSGTTLLLSLLSAHPGIYAVPYETKSFTPDYPLEGGVSTDEDLYIDFLYSHFLEDRVDLREYDRWCEKTPMNVHFFDRLVNYFGSGMRFLNIVRDGRDVVTSRHPKDPTSYWVAPSRWVRDVQAGREIEDHAQCLTVRYEDLIEDHLRCLREICRFIGEDYSKSFEDYPKSSSLKSSVAWFDKAESVHKRSRERWKKEEHEEVVEKLLSMPKAEDHLKHYNYM
jgi:hypothetical protein